MLSQGVQRAFGAFGLGRRARFAAARSSGEGGIENDLFSSLLNNPEGDLTHVLFVLVRTAMPLRGNTRMVPSAAHRVTLARNVDTWQVRARRPTGCTLAALERPGTHAGRTRGHGTRASG